MTVMEYYGIIKRQKNWLKFAVIIFGIYIIYNSVLTDNLKYFPFGIIMILATFFNKKHIISEKGIDILYIVCGIKFHNIWNWQEINVIYLDYKKSKPNIEFHIAKNLLYRKFILYPDDALKALDFISKMNPKISVKEIKK